MKILAVFIIALSGILLSSYGHAHELVSANRKYIHKDTNRIIELGGWYLSEDGRTNKFFNYSTNQYEVVDMNDYFVETDEELDGVKVGTYFFVDTQLVNSAKGKTNRLCQVYHLFTNNKAHVGCQTSLADKFPDDQQRPEKLDFIIHNFQNAVLEVDSLDGYQKGSIAEINVEKNQIKNGSRVKLLAIFNNGEALIERKGFSFFNSSSLLFRGNVEKVKLSDLRN